MQSVLSTATIPEERCSMQQGHTSLLDGLACWTCWSQDGNGLWPYLATREHPCRTAPWHLEPCWRAQAPQLRHSSEAVPAPGTAGQQTSGHANSSAWCMEPWMGIRRGRHCLPHRCDGGAGRGPNERMSCIMQSLTKLFRLNQAQNNTKMELAGQQSSHLWNHTNYFHRHLVKMWIDYCHLWKYSAVTLFTASYQRFLVILL